MHLHLLGISGIFMGALAPCALADDLPEPVPSAVYVAPPAEPAPSAATVEVLSLQKEHNPAERLLHTACRHRAPLRLFHALIAEGAELNAVDGIGQSAMHACAQSCAECIPVLAAAGGQIDLGDQLGRTPLEMALDVSRLDTAEALLRAGANPNTDNRDGNSPYMLALYRNPNPAMARLMERFGGRLSLLQRARHWLRSMDPRRLLPFRT